MYLLVGGTAIVGDIIIAENVKIGANLVIVKSIDTPNVSIGGVPAKIIFNKGISK